MFAYCINESMKEHFTNMQIFTNKVEQYDVINTTSTSAVSTLSSPNITNINNSNITTGRLLLSGH